MSIEATCPSCGKRYTLAATSAGARAKCGCGQTFVVPAPAPADDVYDFVTPDPAIAPPPLPRVAASRAAVATAPVRTLAPPTKPSATPKIVGGFVALFIVLVAIALLQRAGAKRAAEFAELTFRPLAPVPASAWPNDDAWQERGGMKELRIDVPNAAGYRTQLVITLPADASPSKRVGCVFVAPAGSRMFHGMALTREDERESRPYVSAGMGSILYSIGGPLDERDLERPAIARGAFRIFRISQGGFADAEAAIEYALAKRPEIDPSRLYVAGHSSAASLSLLVAAKDDRIKACCAYAPATDLIARSQAHLVQLEDYLPGFRKFSFDISPVNLPTPRGRVFLFSAEDDDNVTTAEVRTYAAKLSPTAKLMTVPTGGHYDSMMREGLPAGVRFLQTLDAARH